MILNIDGKFTDPDEPVISATDGAFLYGETLFETMKAKGAKILLLDEHLERIEHSAALLDFPFPRQEIEAALRQTAGRLSAPVSRMRLTLSRGAFSGLAFPPEGHARFVISADDYEEPVEEFERGIACVFAPNRRVNPTPHLLQIKRGNFADCLYAVNHARKCGAREALFVTEGDLLLEGATSNIFLLREGTLLTPPAGTLVLGGIMRGKVLQAAGRLGINVEARRIEAKALFEAEEVFITNSLIDILPVASVEGKSIARAGVSEKLLEAIREI